MRPVLRSVALFFSAAPLVLGSRTMTVANQCSYTIWPAIFTDANSTVPTQPTGWEAAPNTQVTFELSDTWSGRLWGRTDCSFSGANTTMPQSCITGGCNGGLLCALSGGTGVPPCTVAELTLGGGGGVDWYDVSAVDGTNIPLSMYNTEGCNSCLCSGDLNTKCPSSLQVKNPAGTTVGCKSDCLANPTNAEYCCTGAYHDPTLCLKSNIPDYAYFKAGCPDGYCYAYDDNNNSLFTCPSTKAANYIMVFCPASGNTTTIKAGTVGSTSSDAAASGTMSSAAASLAAASSAGTGTSAASGTTAAASGSSATEAATSPASANTASGTGTDLETSGSTAAVVAGSSSTATGAGAAGAGSTSSGSDTASSSSSTASSTGLFGLSVTAEYAIGGGIALVLLIAIGFGIYMCMRSPNGAGAAAAAGGHSSDSNLSTDSDSDAGKGKKKKKHHDESSSESSADEDALEKLRLMSRRGANSTAYGFA